MKRGDLVQIKVGLVGAGYIGVVIGPSSGAHGARGCFDVLFGDGVFPTHPSSLRTRVMTPRPRQTACNGKRTVV